jgi:peptide/nickel transport system permease protein
MSKRQRYVLRRAGAAAVIAFVAITFSFVLFRALPGDAVSNIAQSPRMTLEIKEVLRRNFGLDQPLTTQYVLYLGQLAHGNMGRSFQDSRPVTEVVLRAAANTIPMAALGTLIGMVVGTLIGVTAAYRQGSSLDRAITGTSMVLYALPVQWLGLLMIALFAGVLPTSGMSDPYLIDPSFMATFQDRLEHMLLPSTCMALLLFGSFALVVRSSQLEALADDHVLTARAKGYRNRRVVWREAFRSAMLPLVSLSTLTLGFLIAGGILTETVFGWPGVGRLTVQAVSARDYPLLQGIFLVITLSVVFFNFLGDILHAVLDPRVTQ